MGNFEKLSVLVIVVIIVMILVVALYTWSDNPGEGPPANREVTDSTKLADPVPDSNERSGSGIETIDDWDKAFLETGKGSDSGEPAVNNGEIEEPALPEPPTPEPDPTPDPKPDVPAPAQEEWVYTVKAGDTLTEISERELETWRRYKEILKLNAGVTAETLREGQTLKMPPRQTAASSVKVSADAKGAGKASSRRGSIPTGEHYVIQRGDTLESISKRAYGTIDRWPGLWGRNLSVLDDCEDLPVGTKIFIPK